MMFSARALETFFIGLLAGYNVLNSIKTKCYPFREDFEGRRDPTRTTADFREGVCMLPYTKTHERRVISNVVSIVLSECNR